MLTDLFDLIYIWNNFWLKLIFVFNFPYVKCLININFFYFGLFIRFFKHVINFDYLLWILVLKGITFLTLSFKLLQLYLRGFRYYWGLFWRRLFPICLLSWDCVFVWWEKVEVWVMILVQLRVYPLMVILFDNLLRTMINLHSNMFLRYLDGFLFILWIYSHVVLLQVINSFRVLLFN